MPVSNTEYMQAIQTSADNSWIILLKEHGKIGTSVLVSGNVACPLHSANEGNTRFWRYFSRH